MSSENGATPILEVRQLVKKYAADVVAVDGVSFAIEPGYCTGLLGPNGAGKTTTIEIIEGVTRATSGVVLYRGEVPGAQFQQCSGIQFQATALQDFLTVRETLKLFHALYENPVSLDELIETCALGELLTRDNRKLSGGQRQRLLLAVALVNQPDILFLDEPTTGLDPQARRNFWDLIERIKRRGTTIILTTHYMDEAYQLCDRIIIMDRGKVVDDGSPDSLLAQHSTQVVMRIPTADLLPATLAEVSQGVTAADQLLQRGGSTEIHTADPARFLKIFSNTQSTLARLSIRPYNLEDLFIDLTGRELRT